MQTLTNTTWAAQPYFVMSDAAYDRMYQKLKNGSRFEWSFTSVVCEKDASGMVSRCSIGLGVTRGRGIPCDPPVARGEAVDAGGAGRTSDFGNASLDLD